MKTYRLRRVLRARPTLLLGSVAVAVGLAACSTFSTDKVDYRAVERSKPLDIPPDLSQLPRDDRNAVPGASPASVTASAVTTAAATQGAAPGGAANLVSPSFPNARIERAGNQRWIAVDVPPERAFAVVREFWPTVGLGIDREDPSAGIIETVWAENRAKLPQDVIRRTLGRVLDTFYSTGEQDRYRVRVERTPKNTSEIYLTHRGMIEVYTVETRDQTVWQPRPSDPQLEGEMLQRLLNRFGNPPAGTVVAAGTPGAPGASRTAAAPGSATAPGSAAGAAQAAGATASGAPAGPQVVRLVRGDDGATQRVDIDEPFDRAWRRVGLALDRGGFTVEDRDRTKGTYFVRYLDPEFEARQREKQGFFSRIFGRELKLETQQFRVAVAAAGNATQVTVLDKDGKPAADATGQKILTQLNEQLR